MLLKNKHLHSLVREVKKNPRISAPKLASELERRDTIVCNNVRNTLYGYGYNGRLARTKFWVNTVNRKKKFDFANTHQMKLDFWNNVLFTDESKFNIFGSDGRPIV